MGGQSFESELGRNGNFRSIDIEVFEKSRRIRVLEKLAPMGTLFIDRRSSSRKLKPKLLREEGASDLTRINSLAEWNVFQGFYL